jgi:hypothetical protein
VMPLLEDSARFTALAQRQRDLAERLKSLSGKDRPDDPTTKARMRDLQAEQQQLREDLSRLLEDIEDHLAKLPESPELEQLRSTAQEFVEGLRGSGASEAMSEAESGLAEFSGTRGGASAGRAAEILEQFLNKSEGMGGQGRACLKFAPGLGQSLGQTVEQLLADMGLGDGAGSGGYSTRRNSLDNVGLYGRMPMMEQSSGGSRRNQQTGAVGTRGGTTPPGRSMPGTANPSARTASGSAEALVPVPYRRRVAEYFQRIADETGGK